LLIDISQNTHLTRQQSTFKRVLYAPKRGLDMLQTHHPPQVAAIQDDRERERSRASEHRDREREREKERERTTETVHV